MGQFVVIVLVVIFGLYALKRIGRFILQGGAGLARFLGFKEALGGAIWGAGIGFLCGEMGGATTGAIIGAIVGWVIGLISPSVK